MDGESIVFCVSELLDYAFEKTIRQGREGKKELIGLLNVGWVEGKTQSQRHKDPHPSPRHEMDPKSESWQELAEKGPGRRWGR